MIIRSVDYICREVYPEQAYCTGPIHAVGGVFWIVPMDGPKLSTQGAIGS